LRLLDCQAREVSEQVNVLSSHSLELSLLVQKFLLDNFFLDCLIAQVKALFFTFIVINHFAI